MKNSVTKYWSPLAFYWICGMIGNGLNWLYNFFVLRSLSIADFSIIALFLSFQFIISMPAVALQTTANKFGAVGLAKSSSQLHQQLNQLWKLSWLMGISLTLIYLISLPLIINFFHLPHNLALHMVISTIALWFFPLAWGRGILSAKEVYSWVGIIVLIEGISKLGLGIASHYGQSSLLLAALGIPGSLAISLGVTMLIIKRFRLEYLAKLTGRIKVDKQIRAFYWQTLLLGIGVALLYNLDLILVKHYFSASRAGIYATLALVGKTIFFVTYSLVGVQVPILSARLAKHQPIRPILSAMTLLTVLLGGGITVIFNLIPQYSLKLLIADRYLDIMPLLLPYCLAIIFLSIAATFATYYLLTKDYRFTIVILLAAIMLSLAISWFHESLSQIVWIMVWIMGGLAVTSVSLHLIKNQTRKLLQ